MSAVVGGLYLESIRDADNTTVVDSKVLMPGLENADESYMCAELEEA